MVTIDTIQRRQRRFDAAGDGTLGGGRRLGAFAHAALRWLSAMAARRRSRYALLEMTDDQLRDIGVSRDAARREGLRPFWD